LTDIKTEGVLLIDDEFNMVFTVFGFC
jgi:hypothetical protein